MRTFDTIPYRLRQSFLTITKRVLLLYEYLISILYFVRHILFTLLAGEMCISCTDSTDGAAAGEGVLYASSI